MFCPKCGKEINDNADVCIHCGRSLKAKTESNPAHNEKKTALGVILGLFLGLIGLIIGMCLYPAGTVARQSFVKAWLITFFSCLGISILLIIICVCLVM